MSQPRAASEANAPTETPLRDQGLRRLVGYNMKRSYTQVRNEVLRVLAPFDLTPVSFSTLTLIVDNPGVQPKLLASGLAIKRANLVGQLDRLEQRGLVRRAAAPHDGRAMTLFATQAGAQMQRDAAACVVQMDAAMVAGFSDEEVALLRRALNQIETDLDKEATP